MPVSMRGTVETFDDEVGLGSVRGDDGRTYGFHCTQIAGGTRSIAPGTDVRFEVIAGHLGRWEAAGLWPAGV